MATPQPNLSAMNLAGAVDLEGLKHKVSAQEGEQGGAPAAGKYVIDVTTASFEAMVRTSATFPILLLLWVKNDDRCFPMARKLADIVNGKDGQLQLARIDVTESPEIAQALRIKGAPALFALINGQPMPILEGVPHEQEMQQIEDAVIPQILQVAKQAGVAGTAPMSGDGDQSADEGASADDAAEQEQVPQAHQQADELAKSGDYSGAAVEYAHLMELDPHDVRAAREHSKCLLLARNGASDVRAVREAAAAKPDDVEAQLDVADVDMIGGQVKDAFDRLLDFLATHPADKESVRARLLEYFAMCPASDERVAQARRRLATLMY